MRTTWNKLVHHVGTIHGHEIRNDSSIKDCIYSKTGAHSRRIGLTLIGHGKKGPVIPTPSRSTVVPDRSV